MRRRYSSREPPINGEKLVSPDAGGRLFIYKLLPSLEKGSHK